MIAIPRKLDYDFSNEKLYCYFPIRNFSTLIHALLHAPFITNNYRDDVPNDSDEINKKMFVALLGFAKETVEKIEDSTEKALKIKTLTWFPENKIWKTDSFDLKKKYFDCILESKVLPTVNGKYISIKDEPKCFLSYFPEEFKGDEFENLIVLLEPSIFKFIKELASYGGYTEFEYTEKELSEKISKIAKETDDVTRDVKLFLWWSEIIKSSHFFPSFLKDDKNNWIDGKSTVYLPKNDGGIANLPQSLSWVQLCILDSKYKSEIIRQIKEKRKEMWNRVASNYAKDPDDNRILGAYSEKYLTLKLVDQSSYAQMIRTINQQIITVEQSQKFISWFFEKFDKELKEGSELSKISYNFPNRKLEIKDIKSLYLGADYNNPIAEKLFESTNFQPIVDVKSIYNGNDETEFIDFLKRCGVKKFPEIISTGDLIRIGDFKSFVLGKYEKNLSGFRLDSPSSSIYSKTVENFEKLIKELSTNDIVEWLTKDEKLRLLITSCDMQSSAYQQRNWAPKYFPSNAYIRYVLNRTPWIELDGQKYSPSQIVKYDKLGNLLPGFYGISEQKLVLKLGKDIVYLFNLDFKDSFAQFSDVTIKKILVNLPETDKNGIISKKIYQDIINEKKGVKPTYSLDGIKVFTKKGCFCINTEVKYADRKTTRQEDSQNNFIFVSPKQSTETVRNWLGVERYKSNLVWKSSERISRCNFNDEFESEINDIKIAVLSSIDANEVNVSILKNLTVIPCSKVCVIDGEKENEEIVLDDYYFVEKDKSYYLKLPLDVEIEQLRLSNLFRSGIVDIFKQILTLELESDLIELLLSMDRKSKSEKVDERFGYGKWMEAEELLFKKKCLNEKIEEFFKENGARPEQIGKISKINFFDKNVNLSNLKIIIESLKDINKDVQDLNPIDEYLNIDLTPYWQNCLQKIKDLTQELYKSSLFESLKNSAEKKNFLKKMDEFYGFMPKLPNSVNCDVEQILKDNFTFLNEKMISKSGKEIDGQYNTNFDKMADKYSISKEDLDDFLNKNDEVRSILYFDIPDNAEKAIKDYLEKNKDESPQKPLADDEDTGTETVTLEPPEQSSTYSYGPRKPQTPKDFKRKNENNVRIGKEAEKIAFKELKKTYKNLIWHSENSIVPADKVKSKYPPNRIVCDMWNNDPVNGNTYFEVKAKSDSFEMSWNEYESMKKNKDNYIIILADATTRKISPHKFEEVEKLKRPSAYTFKFKKIEK